MLKTVNEFINLYVTYVPDVQDYWKALHETMNDRTGDCEDMAIAKYFLLRENAVHPIVVYGFLNGRAHMVTLADRYILDSVNDVILEPEQRTDFEPVYGFDHDNMYIAQPDWEFEVAGPATRLSKWQQCLERHFDHTNK